MRGIAIITIGYKRLKRLSPFAVACALVAVSYFGYRAFMTLGPNGLGALLNRPAAAVDIGCSEDVDHEPALAANTLPLISNQHQQYIYRQPARGPNLVANSMLEDIDNNTLLPKGYFWTHGRSYLTYSFERDKKTNTPFLRVTTSKKLSADETAGSWITQPLPIESNDSYAYSLTYRSNVPLTVSAEYTMDNGEQIYEPVSIIDGIGEWRRFSYYLNNFRGATHFRIILASHEPGYVDTHSYNVHKIASASLSQGIVSIAFDDGWQSIADKALPLLSKMNIPTTQYIITEASDKQVPLYMPMDTLRDFKQAGHEIGSHTLAHCDQTQLPNDEILKNASDSKSALEARDLGPITSYAYPYGTYDDNTQLLVGRVYPYVRTSDAGYNDRYFDTSNIRSMMALSTTKDEEIQSWLDYAARNKLWLVITYHRIDEHGPYSVNSQHLARQLELIKQSGLQIMTVSQAAKTIRPQ